MSQQMEQISLSDFEEDGNDGSNIGSYDVEEVDMDFGAVSPMRESIEDLNDDELAFFRDISPVSPSRGQRASLVGQDEEDDLSFQELQQGDLTEGGCQPPAGGEVGKLSLPLGARYVTKEMSQDLLDDIRSKLQNRDVGNPDEDLILAQCMLRRWVVLSLDPFLLLWDPLYIYTEALCKDGTNKERFANLLRRQANRSPESIYLFTGYAAAKYLRWWPQKKEINAKVFFNLNASTLYDAKRIDKVDDLPIDKSLCDLLASQSFKNVLLGVGTKFEAAVSKVLCGAKKISGTTTTTIDLATPVVGLISDINSNRQHRLENDARVDLIRRWTRNQEEDCSKIAPAAQEKSSRSKKQRLQPAPQEQEPRAILDVVEEEVDPLRGKADETQTNMYTIIRQELRELWELQPAKRDHPFREIIQDITLAREYRQLPRGYQDALRAFWHDYQSRDVEVIRTLIERNESTF